MHIYQPTNREKKTVHSLSNTFGWFYTNAEVLDLTPADYLFYARFLCVDQETPSI